MLETAVALSLFAGDFEIEHPTQYAIYAQQKPPLTEKQREFLFAKIHFAYKKVEIFTEMAKEEAKLILNYNTKRIVLDAIAGAIVGIQGGSPASVVISSCLAIIAGAATEATDHWIKSYEYMQEARTYAIIAEDAEIELLMG
jgi:hypothetical protein